MTGKQDDKTRLVHAGRQPERFDGVVNPPVYHASTVLFPTVEKLHAASANPFEGVYYGRFGTPTHFAFEQALSELEHGYRAVTASSGLAAISIALLSCLQAGDHVLVADTVYGPTRKFCDGMLKRMGIETTYYDPLIGSGIEALIRDNTRAVFLESPGSLTFEMQDVPAISAAAHARGLMVIMDNTWATPLYFKAIDHGVDIVIHAATKYIVGHADAMLGALVCTEDSYAAVKRTAVELGQCAGPDDVNLGLRGLRSLQARLVQHAEHASQLCHWFGQQPEVVRVLYPALENDPGYSIWQRDFSGASGLFGVVLDDSVSEAALTAMLDGMQLFGMGYSWGGYESLILPTQPAGMRTATAWQSGLCLRVHAGLESPADLLGDLEAGFERLRNAR